MESWTWLEEGDGVGHLVARFAGLLGGAKKGRRKYNTRLEMDWDYRRGLLASSAGTEAKNACRRVNSEVDVMDSSISNKPSRNVDEIRTGEGEVEATGPSVSNGSNGEGMGGTGDGEYQVANSGPGTSNEASESNADRDHEDMNDTEIEKKSTDEA